jgi:hypothetical protein
MSAESLTATVEDFRQANGLTRDQVFDMLRRGDIRGVKIGKRRMIVLESYRTFLGLPPPHTLPHTSNEDVTRLIPIVRDATRHLHRENRKRHQQINR